jgi:Glycosyltransferase family 9 (heptosyltransferase)
MQTSVVDGMKRSADVGHGQRLPVHIHFSNAAYRDVAHDSCAHECHSVFPPQADRYALFLGSVFSQSSRNMRRSIVRRRERVKDSSPFRLASIGTESHTRDPQRSIPLAQFEPLAQIPGVTLYSLQKGCAALQLRHFSAKPTVTDLAPHLHDFADTAALLSTLDLLISVDAATAHLAGALGKPVWILLPHVPDWRWLLHRDDSPWYPLRACSASRLRVIGRR